MTLSDVFAAFPELFLSSVFLLSLLVGSFLNVVIYRLPIMLDREWRRQSAEMLSTPAPGSRHESDVIASGAPASLPRSGARCGSS